MSAERRYTAMAVETRASESTKHAVGGYAAKFNLESRNLGGFVEVVDTGAFNASRGDGWPDVVARYNHDDNMLLGSTGGGTLQLRVDGTGLDYEVDLPASRADIYELVQRGDVRKSSFAFRTIEDDWSANDQGFPRRTLLKVQLVDVAPVNTPAYVDTSTGIRSELGSLADKTGAIEAALRSLANRFDAELEEVRKLAVEDNLRKFFARTSKSGKPEPEPTTLGAKARVELLGRASDPYV